MTRITSTHVLAALLAAAAAPAPAQEQSAVHTTDDQALEWGPCPAFLPEGCEIAVLNGDPAEPNVDIFFRVPGGAEVARHWHTSPERMVLVEGRMDVTYDGEDTVTLDAGTYAHGPAEKPHRATCLSDGPCTLFIALVDPLDAHEGGSQ